MPIFSLPSKYGIGSFGSESYKFVDFLSKAGQSIWQILPLVQTGYGNSPYSSVSSESFNPYFISIDNLVSDGLLTKAEAKFAISNKEYIDYEELYSVRYPLLRKAFSRFDRQNKDFKKYLSKKESLDYALFMAIKYASGQKHFYEWDEKFARRDKKALNDFAKDYLEELLFYQFIQYRAKTEWLALKAYANSKGVKIMGDMPLYVALDSVDVWVNPSLYKLDENFIPKKVAGVPPDYFCEDGQLWGNPVYDYSVHKQQDFSWWKERLEKALTIFDYVRIDHFRGLDRYYEVDYGQKDAKVGEWVEVPSVELFNKLHNFIDKSRIIAEDLGIIDDGVRELLEFTGYPGMKILSFAFNGESGNLYLPENVNENSVCYTGTHDNDTLLGLINNSTDWDYNNLYRGVNSSLNKFKIPMVIKSKSDLIDAIIELGFACRSIWFILPYQDVIKLGSEYRINQPSTVKAQNWAIKFKKDQFALAIMGKLKKLTNKYDRNH